MADRHLQRWAAVAAAALRRSNPGVERLEDRVLLSASVRLGILGDFTAGQDAQDVAALVKSWNPDAVVTTGDNCYPSDGAGALDASVGQNYHQFIAPYKGQYGAGSTTGNHFFPTMGNHDWEDPQTYLNYFTLPNNERYYDVTVGNVEIFVLDGDPSEPDGNTADSTQAAWLQHELAVATAPWKLVTIHQAPYSSSANHGSDPDTEWPFKAWGATAVFSGHDHDYERLNEQGLPYFVAGLGGGCDIYPFDTPIAGSQVRYNDDYGALLVTASDTALSVQFFTRAGELVDSDTINRPTTVPAAPSNLAGTAVSSSQIHLTWTDNASNETGFKLERSSNGTTFTQIATLAANATSYADSGLSAATKYYYRLRATNATGDSGYSGIANATTPTVLTGDSLFTANADIGGPGLAGSSSVGNGVYTLSGAGTDIWGTADQCQFAFKATTGDVTLITRVSALTNTNAWTKAGLMLRNGTAADAQYVDLLVTAANGVSFQTRAATGGTSLSTQVAGVTAPTWLKLTRSGNTFMGYYSSDGISWKQVGAAQTLATGSTLQAGLVVTSHDITKLATATFDNVSVNGTVTPPGVIPGDSLFTANADIGGPTLAGSSAMANGVYTLSGAGTDIWGTADQFQFASKNATGDVTLITRVSALTNTNTWAKAGLMLRNGTAADAQYVDLLVTAANGVSFQYRASTSGVCLSTQVAGVAAPTWLKLIRSGNTFTGYYSSDGITWKQVGAAQTLATGSTLQAGLVVTSHDITKLATATFDNVSVNATVTPPEIIPGDTLFTANADIGGPGLAGSSAVANGVYTLKGGGTDIWGACDQFQFASMATTGDATLITRVTSLTNTNTWAKAGLMLRNGTGAEAQFVDILVTPSNGVSFQYRAATGGVCFSTQVAGVAAPTWLKLTRSGNTFTGYYSLDGITWKQVGAAQTLVTGSTLQGGLVVTSHDITKLATASFDNVSVSA